MENDNQSSSKGLRVDREYSAEETAAEHAPFIKILGYVFLAHTIGLLSCIAIHQQYPDIEGVQGLMLSSGMIFAIGLIPTILAYFMFRSVVAMSREAAAKAKDEDEEGERDSVAADMNAAAMKRAKNGFKLLSFSGICFVASTLIGVSGLLSL